MTKLASDIETSAPPMKQFGKAQVVLEMAWPGSRPVVAHPPRAVSLLMVIWLSFLSCPAWSEDSSAAQTLPSAADLRLVFDKWGLTARQQGGRPTCSAFTIAAALEFAVAQKQQGCERLSVEFLNWASNQILGQTNDGGMFSNLLKGYETHGICLEQEMPYRAQFDPSQPPVAEVIATAKSRLGLGLRPHWIKEWDVHTGLTDEQFLALKRTLSRGWPVCVGFRWPKQQAWENDVLQMCPPDAVFDGHSVLLVGYRDDPKQAGGGVFIIRNSGRGRDDCMPYVYARAYMNDAVWIGAD